MKKTVSKILRDLEGLHLEKNLEYGNQGVLIQKVMKACNEECNLSVTSSEGLGDFHFINELLAKTLRIINIRFSENIENKSTNDRRRACEDSLRDLAIYSAMLIEMFEEEDDEDEEDEEL